MNGRKRIKALLKSKRQEIIILKRTIKLNAENHRFTLNEQKGMYEGMLQDYNDVMNDLKVKLGQTQIALKEANRKKWYQFRRIN
jgi:flagellar motor switch/type III secretory pathway protein FliN